MKQEDKDLLLKDLCGRLPYGVKLYCHSNQMMCIGPYTLDTIVLDRIFNKHTEYVPFDEVKPYLFPMSSMTEEQEEELKNIYYSFNGMFHYAERIFDKIPFSKMKYFPYQVEEFFNKNHIDYRGLIPMGLANDATDKNIY